MVHRVDRGRWQYVAEKKKQAATRPAPMTAAASGATVPGRTTARVVSVRDVGGPQGPAKA